MDYRCRGIEEVDGDGKSPVGFLKNQVEYEIITPYGLILPYTVNSKDRNNFKILKKYAHCIKKALTKERVKSKLQDNAGEKGNPIAALHIVSDYMENGIYREYEKEYKKADTGKIDFIKTIKHMSPTVYRGSLLYDKYVVKKKKISEGEIVALAQANVINHFMNNGGDVFFGNFIFIDTKHITMNSKLIHELNVVKGASFNSRKQQLIQWMVMYIKGALINKNEKGNWMYSIIASTFWEEMIDSCYSNQIRRDKTVYGKQHMVVKNGKIIRVGSSTQHDTIYEDDQRVIILDAKMYKRQSLVEAKHEVLEKQFGYYKQAKIKNPNKDIYNVLVLPYIESDCKNRGFQRDFYPNYEDGDYNNVILVYRADFVEILETYYRGKKLHILFNGELDRYINSAEHFDDRKASNKAYIDNLNRIN